MTDFTIVFPAGRHHGDPSNGNLDCHIITEARAVYSVTFFTIQNVVQLLQNNLNERRYFWASDMVIVPSLSDSDLIASVNGMIQNEVVELCGEFLGNAELVYGVRGPRDFIRPLRPMQGVR